jgi:hypothetical protein
MKENRTFVMRIHTNLFLSGKQALPLLLPWCFSEKMRQNNGKYSSLSLESMMNHRVRLLDAVIVEQGGRLRSAQMLSEQR